MIVQSVALLYLVVLRHECCGTSTSEIYEDGGGKRKEDCFGQWGLFPKYFELRWSLILMFF